jgi:hypothetical protein
MVEDYAKTQFHIRVMGSSSEDDWCHADLCRGRLERLIDDGAIRVGQVEFLFAQEEGTYGVPYFEWGHEYMVGDDGMLQQLQQKSGYEERRRQPILDVLGIWVSDQTRKRESLTLERRP